MIVDLVNYISKKHFKPNAPFLHEDGQRYETHVANTQSEAVGLNDFEDRFITFDLSVYLMANFSIILLPLFVPSRCSSTAIRNPNSPESRAGYCLQGMSEPNKEEQTGKPQI
jgi:hypothetical protein